MARNLLACKVMANYMCTISGFASILYARLHKYSYKYTYDMGDGGEGRGERMRT